MRLLRWSAGFVVACVLGAILVVGCSEPTIGPAPKTKAKSGHSSLAPQESAQKTEDLKK